MSFKSDKSSGLNCVIYLSSILTCLLQVGVAYDIWTPYARPGPFPSLPTTFVGTSNQHTAFIGNVHHHPIVSSQTPFLRTSPVVRNISLLMPNRGIVPWWPSISPSGGHIIVDGVQIKIDNKGNQKKPTTGGTRTSIVSSSKPCGKNCGEDGDDRRSSSWSSSSSSWFPNNIRGVGSTFPQSASVVKVWKESTSQYNPFNIYIEERGSYNSPTYQIYYKNDDGPISPFHDIPLFANEGNKIFNMVVEVPRWTNAKMEIATKDPLNPIKQDMKKGKLRYVANCFPHHGYIWNYGALPQTWEDPEHVDETTGCRGDNDPIDVCEIGYRVAKRGEVIQVKVLGVLALIDEGETDWKLIAIDVNDPMAPQLSDIADVEKHMPGFLKATVEWFRIYKIPDGKPENQFAFNGMAKDRDFAHKIVMETHEAWQNLIEGKADPGGLSNSCVRIPNAVNKLSQTEADQVVKTSPESGPAVPLDPKVDLWHYVSLK